MKNYVQHFCKKILLNYPEDYFYESWEERQFEGECGFDEAFEILNAKKLSYGMLSYKNISIIISIRSSGSCRGILFEIPEEDILQNNYADENLNKVESQIVEELVKLWGNMEFNYAFCDNEADIEYIPAGELQNEKYSILLLKDKFNRPSVCYGTWHINGLSSRTIE